MLCVGWDWGTCVTAKVKAVYATSVPAVSPARAGPHFHARMPATSDTSSAVGTTLNTMLLRIKLMPAQSCKLSINLLSIEVCHCNQPVLTEVSVFDATDRTACCSVVVTWLQVQVAQW